MGANHLFMLSNSAMDASDDKSFMENLYLNYMRLMFSTARKFVSRLPDQKDIVQDTMEKLIKNISTIRPMNRRTLTSYIVCTIRNTSIDFLRRQGKIIEQNISLDEEEFLDMTAAAPSPDDLLITATQLDLLRSIWPTLTEDDRILLEGKYILGYTDAELALQLKCEPSSVRMKLTRARRRALEGLTEMNGV